MYKLNKKYEGQDVTVYTPNNEVIKLEHASQKDFEKAYKIKGNEKFITKLNKAEEKEILEDKEIEKEIIKEEKNKSAKK